MHQWASLPPQSPTGTVSAWLQHNQRLPCAGRWSALVLSLQSASVAPQSAWDSPWAEAIMLSLFSSNRCESGAESSVYLPAAESPVLERRWQYGLELSLKVENEIKVMGWKSDFEPAQIEMLLMLNPWSLAPTRSVAKVISDFDHQIFYKLRTSIETLFVW